MRHPADQARTIVDKTVMTRPTINTVEVNRLIGEGNNREPGKILRRAEPPFALEGNDRIVLHANLNGVTIPERLRNTLKKAAFCTCSVYRDEDGNFEFRGKMCYKVWPATDWGAYARHIREEHLSLPVKR